MSKFTINGVSYPAKPFTFNLICELEEKGVSMEEMRKKPTSTARAYFALCAGFDDETAGSEIEKHLIAGEDLTGLINAMTQSMNESDFFLALSKNAEKKAAKKKEKE
jgi:hypothetical protein